MDKRQQMVREEKLRYWRPIINAYENRETKLMSIAQWCREHEINASLFYYWKNVIRETDASNRKASSGSVPETENFVDITDIVNGQARPDVNTIGSEPGTADDSGSRSRSNHSDLPRITGTPEEGNAGSVPGRPGGPAVSPEVILETRSCRLYLYSSVRRETLSMLKEVFHVC